MNQADLDGTGTGAGRRDGASELPPGRSHWDRLPRELADMVLAADTSLLTQFSSGRMLAFEVRAMCRDARERLLAEALDCEWSGDVGTLPRVAESSECLLGVRTRRMLRRLAAAGVASGWMQARAAVRHGWTDMLDMRRPHQQQLAAEAAARESALSLVEELVCERETVRPTPDLAVAAATGGHIGVLELLHRLMSHDACWDAAVVDCAAEHGHLDVLAWLRGLGHSATGRRAMVKAARNGRLRVVEWLVDHCAADCPPDAVVGAAVNGHHDVVVFLHSRFPDLLGGMDGDVLLGVWDARVLDFLHTQSLVASPRLMLSALAAHGRCDGFRWVCRTFGLQTTQQMLDLACERDSADLVRWMLAQPGIEVSRSAMVAAVAGGCIGVLGAMLERDTHAADGIARAAVALKAADVIEWLDVRHDARFTQRTLEIAADLRDVECVARLLKSPSSATWDLNPARSLAATRDRKRIRKLLDDHARRRGAFQRRREEQ
nr:hypothetical protein HK105_004141 [Polyrhizophydium stewartii]